MTDYTLQVTFNSPTLIGSGEGFGATIDTDIVFDEVGLPYVPAKRVKGCLRDAVLEVCEMFDRANMKYYQPLQKQIVLTFGSPGEEHSAPVYFSNLTIAKYEENKAWIAYFIRQEAYSGMLSRERILETFTEIRQQTAINKDDGVAKPHSLRTIRVLKKGFAFSGTLTIDDDSHHANILTTLLLACANFRAVGTKRNRGFGEVRCVLLDKHEQELSIQDRWEAIQNYV